MDELWTRLEDFLKQNAPEVYGSLAPGATEAEVADAEETCGVTFPPDVRQSYLRHDGQANEGYNFIPGYFYLYALREMYAGEVEEGNNEVNPESVTDPRVKRVWDDPAWISFAGDIGGNRIRLDFDPLPGGTVGQVLLEDHEEGGVHPVLAPSFTAWLGGIISDLESGRLVWNKELTGYCYPEDL